MTIDVSMSEFNCKHTVTHAFDVLSKPPPVGCPLCREERLIAWARRAYESLNNLSGEHPGLICVIDDFPEELRKKHGNG